MKVKMSNITDASLARRIRRAMSDHVKSVEDAHPELSIQKVRVRRLNEDKVLCSISAKTGVTRLRFHGVASSIINAFVVANKKTEEAIAHVGSNNVRRLNLA